MFRLLLLTHRYLGIGVGALMVMWCLSGVVMMYHGYPELDEVSRVRNLAPIAWSACCKIADETLADDDPVEELQLEMLAGKPALRLRSGSASRMIDLGSGLAMGSVSVRQAGAVAAAYASGALPASPARSRVIDHDQWTVSGEFDADRPLYEFELGDAGGTHVYVSSVTGRAVQTTTARERFWNWLGSVPHWLYFAELRRHPALWSDVVIATSLLGCFLAAAGLCIGVLQWLHRPAGRCSPYHGLNLWHHMAGLAFGVLALAWVGSGLLSMNPWGWLEGAGAQQERVLLRNGPGPTGRQIKAALQAIAAACPAALVSLRAAPFNAETYFIATTAGGERSRLNAGGAPAPLNDVDLKHMVAVLGGTADAATPQLLTQEDNYYFSHGRDLARLPVYRMIRADGTRFYLDAASGTIVAKFDRSARAYRWWQQGLHRLDFLPAMRAHPQWDGLMLLLLSGVTVLCATGTYLGYRRLTRPRRYVQPPGPISTRVTP